MLNAGRRKIQQRIPSGSNHSASARHVKVAVSFTIDDDGGFCLSPSSQLPPLKIYLMVVSANVEANALANYITGAAAGNASQPLS